MANEIAYYSMDTSHFNDVKIKRLRRTHGCEGYSIWAYLLNEIYRVNHYYMTIDDNSKFDLEDYWGLSTQRITEIIDFCVEVGLFDKKIYEQHSILTSKAIQLRYVDMCKRTHRKLAISNDLLLLLDDKPQPDSPLDRHLKLLKEVSSGDKTQSNTSVTEIDTPNEHIKSDNVEQSQTKSDNVGQSSTKFDNVGQSSTKSKNVVLNKRKEKYITPFIPLDGGNTSPTKFDKPDFEKPDASTERKTPRNTSARKVYLIDRNNPPLWIPPVMTQGFADWLEYKCERGQGYRSEKTAIACFDQLYQLANRDPLTAQAIIKQSIASNYAGLFPLKTSSTQPNNFIVRNTQTKVYTKF